jgi:hypothetical protein
MGFSTGGTAMLEASVNPLYEQTFSNQVMGMVALAPTIETTLDCGESCMYRTLLCLCCCFPQCKYTCKLLLVSAAINVTMFSPSLSPSLSLSL